MATASDLHPVYAASEESSGDEYFSKRRRSAENPARLPSMEDMPELPDYMPTPL